MKIYSMEIYSSWYFWGEAVIEWLLSGFIAGWKLVATRLLVMVLTAGAIARSLEKRGRKDGTAV